ncbi:hypothetical protein BH10BAC1_BH10BAC1_20920 [soil metagenome]
MVVTRSMKNIVVFLFIAVIVACSTQKEVAYELPDTMSASIKAEFAKQCEKGEILYNINCARCQTKKERRKEIIPDFSAEQLVGYELRISNPKHVSDMQELTVSAEELGLIMTFLSYKKRNKLHEKTDNSSIR